MLHQPSNFATYCDDDGNQVFDTYFTVATWSKGPALYAYNSWQDREDALDIAHLASVQCEAVGHHDAFMIMRAGTVAWLHGITAGGIQCFRRLRIQFPAIVA